MRGGQAALFHLRTGLRSMQQAVQAFALRERLALWEVGDPLSAVEFLLRAARTGTPQLPRLAVVGCDWLRPSELATVLRCLEQSWRATPRIVYGGSGAAGELPPEPGALFCAGVEALHRAMCRASSAAGLHLPGAAGGPGARGTGSARPSLGSDSGPEPGATAGASRLASPPPGGSCSPDRAPPAVRTVLTREELAGWLHPDRS